MTDDVRKICVITGTRAEYGLLYWLMKEIGIDPALELQLIVTGSHLSNKYGHTVDTIEKDGFNITARVDIDLDDDSPAGIAHSMGLAISGIAKELLSIQPHIVVVLGDRFEILGAVEAAMLHGLPIAHIHGGEVTEGAIDDAMRHAITKLSSFHFAAAEPYRERIIQMGEQPDRVFTVGAPGLDQIAQTQMLPRREIASALNINADTPYFLITMHPTTRSDQPAEAELMSLLTALKAFPDHAAIFTGVNADTGNDAITTQIKEFVSDSKTMAQMFTSLGQLRYLSAAKYADAVLGNSSSGIIEAPALSVPTVNIGDRQKGRLRATSVIDSIAEPTAIISAITKALNPAFREINLGAPSPYGIPGASKRIKNVLTKCDTKPFQQKSFYNVSIMEATS
jgi:UDP-N-acetylglucosamine 2-epimerase (non-hydrolysing)/GDP/UDP-N,N'-diacetylbacillosamine 2-epimerase (hydrolysing)